MKTATMVGMGLGALRHKATGWRAPLNVMLSVTNRCNARCSYCNIPQRKQTELTTQEIIDLVDLLAERGCLRVGLWGGEPLVRKDIGTIVDRCAAHGLWTTLDTNGYLFPQFADRLKNLSHLMISLDGRQKNHDANREPGSWAKTMAGVRCAPSGGWTSGPSPCSPGTTSTTSTTCSIWAMSSASPPPSRCCTTPPRWPVTRARR